jgi:hypothetical protein
MDDVMKCQIEIIHGNLFELVGQLNRVGSFVDSMNRISKELDHYGHRLDLDEVLDDIRDQINDVSDGITQNIRGLKLIAL